jgi:LacI family transcriptional regulator
MEKRVTIYDIAAALDVSVGTVHRAMNDRGGVSAMTRARVLQMAEKMGYRPNLAAKYLSTRRDLVFCVNLPHEPSNFYGPVRAGIEDEAAPFRMAGVTLHFRFFPRLGVGEEEAFEQALEEKADGIIVVPGPAGRLKPLIRRAAREKIPVVCLINDGPGTEKLTTVSVDTAASGALAAELLGRLIHGEGRVAITLGDLSVADHSEKFEAFSATMREMFPAITVDPPVENHESADEAYSRTLKYLQKNPPVKGLYVCTGNGEPVLRAVEEAGRMGGLTIFTTNLYTELVPRLTSGAVTGTIYERPYSQGRIAFRTLHEYLLQNTVPTMRLMLDPVLVMKSNLARVIRRVGGNLHVNGSPVEGPGPNETMVDYIVEQR